MPSSNWSSKTAVICGASSGLGRDFAHELAAQGVARLALISRSLPALELVRDEVRASHPATEVICLAADLRERAQLASVVEQIHAAMGTVDLLIQAVGLSDRGRIGDLTAQRLHELVDVNIVSSLHALQCFEASLTRPGGCAVLIGSLASKFAPRFLGGYAIAKHGLAALAQQARLEWADNGLRVLLACPGPLARQDAGHRYEHLLRDGQLPAAAGQAGGGAKLKGLDPRTFARDVLRAADQGQAQLIRPLRAQWLVWLSALSCSWGDRVLRRNSG